MKTQPENVEKVRQLLEELDDRSRLIVWYIWQTRYAGIGDLTRVIREKMDMITLIRIKETINPLAEKIIGQPLLKFEKSKIDPETGDKVLFSWWLNEDISASVEMRK